MSSLNCKFYSPTSENQLESSVYKLWDYNQSIYHERKECVISAFKTQLFSRPLQKILEIEIDNECLTPKPFGIFFKILLKYLPVRSLHRL